MVTPAPTAPRIFVSYNRQDVAFTRRLVESLERAGATVWVDWEGARDGDFLKRINQGLVRCDWLVLVETPHALKSNPVEMEVDAALNRVLYGQMRGVVRLVATTRDPRSVPPTWATLQYYDATSDYDGALSALLAAIRAGDQRQTHRPGAEHPGAHSVVAPAAPPSALATPAERFISRMATATAASDWQSVVDVADLLLAEFPDAVTTDFYRMHGRALLELGRPGEAAQALRQAYERDNMDIPTMRAAARAALQANDLAGAEPLLKRAVTLADDADERLDILREYVPTLESLGKLDDALIRADQALLLRPDDTAWLTMRRDLLTRLGRNADALAVARTLTARPEATAADWLALARLARPTGAQEEATAALLRAESLAPDAPELESERAPLLMALAEQRGRAMAAEQWSEALVTLEKELRYVPTDPDRLIDRADLLHRLGRDTDAVEQARALRDQLSGALRPEKALEFAQLCVVLDVAGSGLAALDRAGMLNAEQTGAAYELALQLAAQVATLPSALFPARINVARQLVAVNSQRDAWNLLSAPNLTPAAQAQLEQTRAELFPLPDVPTRLASLGFLGVNIAGAQAIIPPLVTVATGPFLMGSDEARDMEARDNELPQHRVELPAFQIGKYPVTVAEYTLAVHAGAVREPPSTGSVAWQTQLQRLDHPVVCVSWQDAQAYVAWLRGVTGATGWRLPSEAQWEKAARWSAQRGVSRIYPWGASFDTTRCNTYESRIRTTISVGSYPANDSWRNGTSPWGAEDMAGNAWEWTSSVYKPYPYTATDGREDDKSTESRTLRGGSWDVSARSARAAYRNASRWDRFYLDCGFRLAFLRPAGETGG